MVYACRVSPAVQQRPGRVLLCGCFLVICGFFLAYHATGPIAASVCAREGGQQTAAVQSQDSEPDGGTSLPVDWLGKPVDESAPSLDDHAGCNDTATWDEVADLEGLQLPPAVLVQCMNQSSLTEPEVKKAVESTLRARSTVVSGPRLRATAWLTWSALTVVGGDIVETGVFTGGSTALMLKQVVEKAARCDTKLWAFDSFKGLPATTVQDEKQGVGQTGRQGEYSATRAQFDKNIAQALQNFTYNDRLVVTPGWFNETLPISQVKRIGFLRLDGDLYVSTMDALQALYDRVAHGGYIYVDDYGSFRGCKRAVDEFRLARNIAAPLHMVHEHGRQIEAVWWRKIVC